MDLCFQGLAWYNKGLTPEHMERARGFFERALALDPQNIEALVGIAEVHNAIVGNFMTDDPAPPHIATAETALTKVLSVAPNHAWAHAAFGRTLLNSNRAARGIAQFEQALALDPNLANAHASIGVAKYFVGRGSETETHIREMFRLSPRDTFAYVWMAVGGVVKLTLGSDEEAVTWLQRSVEANPNFPVAHFWLASALAHLGQLDGARFAVQAGLALDPTFTVSRFRAGALSSNPTYLAQRERIYDAMRKAGVPEG
jgi:tetratricopeptide (TPR) repeat protein